ncbi:MAG: hypothetical protein ACK5A1_14525, partial [Planctomyces sp.]
MRHPDSLTTLFPPDGPPTGTLQTGCSISESGCGVPAAAVGSVESSRTYRSSQRNPENGVFAGIVLAIWGRADSRRRAARQAVVRLLGGAD